ncbi:MAG: glycosyltransferase family 39 protein [Patescibacteria group bacterium]|nr:glycosyltransferase family 39 protein [Patescibacteria group bacterium]
MKFKFDWKIILFLLVIALAAYLRVYNFSDWLFFKMDQARDSLLIKQALENGPGWLPLLGPKAGGTELNLGPAFYYFQYLSAVLFQSVHPAVLAYPDLLFGILSIPLFYFFLKKYFSRDWSMILASLYAVCFLGIQYSRFSWNPNGLVFFNLLFFFSLLNVFDSPRTTENRRDLSNEDSTAVQPEEYVVRGKGRKYRLRWVVLAGFSFAVSTQLHFLSFLTLPVITAVFIALNRKEARKALNWKYILIFLAIVALVYLPVILNEIASKGESTNEFLKALKEKPSAHSFSKNVKRDFRYWGQNWFLILTSWISQKGGTKGALLAWLGAIVPALLLGFKFFRREENPARKKFLLISLLWFVIYFLAYIPIAYQIRPRFFLPLLELPFIFIGYLVIFFWSKKQKFWKICVVAALLIVFFGNLIGTLFWFKEIRAAQNGPIRPWRTIILKAKDGIVLSQLEKAAEFAKKDCGKPLVYYSTSPEYKSPFRYIFSYQKTEAAPILDFKKEKEGCFYAFGLTRSKKRKIDSKIAKKFDIVFQEKIGALSAYKLQPKEEFAENIEFSGEKEEKSKRIFWKDLRNLWK